MACPVGDLHRASPQRHAKRQNDHCSGVPQLCGDDQNSDYVFPETGRAGASAAVHLQLLRVLSQLLLIQSPQVWRFHESVPYRVVPPPAVVSTPVRPRVPVLEPRTEVEEEEMEEQAEEELVEKNPPFVYLQVPTVGRQIWKSPILTGTEVYL